MPQAVEEIRLLEALKNPASKQDAFRQLTEQYARPLYAQIRRMVLNHQDTDDVLQNVFLKIWKGIEGFRGDAKLSTWIYRIAHYESLNFLRSKARKRQHEIPLTEESSSLIDNLVADPYFDGDAAEITFQKALDQLTEGQREVFLLRYYNEYSYKEIAEITGKNIATLKVNYHLAVKSMKKFILTAY